MHNSVFTVKENASKGFELYSSMFLTSFNSIFVCYAYFMCICIIWLCLGRGMAFLVKTGRQPICIQSRRPTGL